MVFNVVPLIPWDAISCFFNAPEILEENPIDYWWSTRLIEENYTITIWREIYETFSFQNFSYLLEIDLCDLTSFFSLKENHMHTSNLVKFTWFKFVNINFICILLTV